jgi:hypothetical protein
MGHVAHRNREIVLVGCAHGKNWSRGVSGLTGIGLSLPTVYGILIAGITLSRQSSGALRTRMASAVAVQNNSKNRLKKA